ncbi:MAG: hypothetical protein KDF65_00300 [Anaerolineae bacterium]|nr:hypothetical protein [Anaerolineae bacterium]
MFRSIDRMIWLVIALSIFAWAPLLTPAYFFEAHDAKHSIFFLVEFDQTFRDGYGWPRWSPDFSFGYGYPLFNLYAPLAFYLAEIIHLLGFGFVTSIKIMYVLATIGAGLSMYGFTSRLFGSRSGLLAAVVYMYAPFHLVEIFVRSAYAEFVALAVIPLVLWTFTELIAAPTPRRAGLAALTYGLLVLTHHSTFFTFSPFLAVYILFLLVARARLNLKVLLRGTIYAAGAGLLGLALAAIYLVPLVSEMRFIKIEQWTSGSYNYLQHFVYFSQLFSPAWGYGYAGPGPIDDFSYQLGIVIITLMSFALLFVLPQRPPHYGTALFFLGATIGLVLLMSPLAEPIWQVLPIASLVQFPWRLLGMTAFTMSIVAGSLLARPVQPLAPALPATQQAISAPVLMLALVMILGSFSYTLPQYTDVPAWSETPLAVVNWDRASIVDRVGMVSVTQEQPQTSPMEAEYLTSGVPTTVAGLIAGQGTVETLHHGGASDRVRVQADGPVTLQFYTYDYPGWRVTLNDQPLAHRAEAPFGLITVDLPAGEHTVYLQMGSTPPRLMGTLLSGLMLLIVSLIIFSPRWLRPLSKFDI